MNPLHRGDTGVSAMVFLDDIGRLYSIADCESCSHDGPHFQLRDGWFECDACTAPVFDEISFGGWLGAAG